MSVFCAVASFKRHPGSAVMLQRGAGMGQDTPRRPSISPAEAPQLKPKKVGSMGSKESVSLSPQNGLPDQFHILR